MGELLPWLRLIGRRKGRLLAGVLLLALTLLAGLGLLALSGWFITASAITGLLFAAGSAVAFDVYVPGGGIRLFAITRTVARYGERVYNHETVLRLLADVRVRLFRGLSAKTVAARSRKRSADWLSRLTSDLDSLDSLYLRLIAPTALALLITSGLVLILTRFYSGITGLVVGALLFLALVLATCAVYSRTRKLSQRRVDKLEQLRGLAIEHLEGQAELTAAGEARRNQHRLLAVASDMSDEQAQIDQRIGWHAAASGFLMHASAVAGLWLGIALLQSGEISGPVLALLPLALQGLNEIYSGLPEAFGRLGGTISAAERLNRDMADDSPDVARQETSSKPLNQACANAHLDPQSIPQAAIKWQEASYNHTGLPAIVRNWSLHIRPGERIGIVGRSGTGKSTLADMAAGLVEPSSGYCWRGGEAGHHPRWSAWLAQISYLPQTTTLLDDTLRNNLLVGLPEATEADLWQVLEMVGLTELVKSLPMSLDTWLGNYGQQVSGGEARRIALARTLLKPAGLIILDEPFTGLDADTREQVRAGVSRVLEGKTLLAFGHSVDALPAVDRISDI
jgi:ATP-binding cassette subfamily C protein CydC